MNPGKAWLQWVEELESMRLVELDWRVKELGVEIAFWRLHNSATAEICEARAGLIEAIINRRIWA